MELLALSAISPCRVVELCFCLNSLAVGVCGNPPVKTRRFHYDLAFLTSKESGTNSTLRVGKIAFFKRSWRATSRELVVRYWSGSSSTWKRIVAFAFFTFLSFRLAWLHQIEESHSLDDRAVARFRLMLYKPLRWSGSYRNEDFLRGIVRRDR